MRNLLVKEFGTPIRAGPGEESEYVGLAGLGEPSGLVPVVDSTVSLTLSFARPAPERTLPSARLTALSSGVGTWVWVEPLPPPELLAPPPELLSSPPCWLPGVGTLGTLTSGRSGTFGTVGVGTGVAVATGPRSTMFW